MFFVVKAGRSKNFEAERKEVQVAFCFSVEVDFTSAKISKRQDGTVGLR